MKIKLYRSSTVGINLGDLKILTDEVEGLEAAPKAFVDLLAGGNIGTRIVNLATNNEF